MRRLIAGNISKIIRMQSRDIKRLGEINRSRMPIVIVISRSVPRRSPTNNETRAAYRCTYTQGHRCALIHEAALITGLFGTRVSFLDFRGCSRRRSDTSKQPINGHEARIFRRDAHIPRIYASDRCNFTCQGISAALYAYVSRTGYRVRLNDNSSPTSRAPVSCSRLIREPGAATVGARRTISHAYSSQKSLELLVYRIYRENCRCSSSPL